MILRIAAVGAGLGPRLRKRFSEVEVCRDRDGLWDLIKAGRADLIVALQGLLPEPHSSFLEALRALPENPALIVLGRGWSEDERARLIAAGGLAVFEDSLPDTLLNDAIERLAQRHLKSLPPPPNTERPSLDALSSEAPTMRPFLNLAQRVTKTDTSLLITGETGVGKEWLARAIHEASRRSHGPFVAINCGALPESLLESELFGHEEGAFTGATRLRRGLFEQAHGGTVFLDEVGEMPPHLQVRLLRVLQSHEVHRIGGERPVRLDVRVMAATNRSLAAELEAERFRRDLYYRLSVVELEVPPLRERIADIRPLAQLALARLQRQLPHAPQALEPDALAALELYSWPGNIRELFNVIERAMLISDGPLIQLQDLPLAIRRTSLPHDLSPPLWNDTPLWWRRPLKELRDDAIARLEREALQHLLRDTQGHIGQTAALAGLDPRSLYSKMKRLQLRKEDFRPQG